MFSGKKCTAFLLLIFMGVLMGGCGSDTDEDKKKSVKVIHLVSAFDEKMPMIQAGQKFADLIKAKSKGSMEVIMVTGGKKGGEKENLQAVKNGAEDMAIFGGFPIPALIPQYGFLDAPFVFKDKEHFMKVWQGKVANDVQNILQEQHGVYSLGIMSRGYRQVTANRPVKTAADMEGLKMRMSQAKTYMETFTALGAECTPLSLTEIYEGLASKRVNSSDGPVDQIYSLKLYDVQKYLIRTQHVYAISMWLMNEKFFNSLTVDERKLVREAAEEALIYGEKLSETAESGFLSELKAKGMQVIDPDRNSFREKVRPTLKELFQTEWNVVTFDEIEQQAAK